MNLTNTQFEILNCKTSLAYYPTPLIKLDNLQSEYNLKNLWMKRDDLTDILGTGSKIRKLEYISFDALQKQADVLVTHGQIQSNHARTTALVAAKLGISSVLLFQNKEPKIYTGNLALAQLLGAEIHFLEENNTFTIQKEIRKLVQSIKLNGKSPYVIPEGGGNGLGALGFVNAIKELSAQLEANSIKINTIIIAVGSGGSLAGIHIGLKLFLPGVRVIGISVGPEASILKKRAAQIANETSKLLKSDMKFKPIDFIIFDDWAFPGYGHMNDKARQSLIKTVRTQGILLDPVYTSKAMSAIPELRKNKLINSDESILFWHTGGLPGLFSDPRLLNDMVN